MNAAIIVAAGRGTRMGGEVDKIFIPLLGRPIVGHTWSTFDRMDEIDHITLVVRDGTQAEFESLADKLGVLKPFRLVPGGAERQDSVWNGLESLPEDAEFVAIQDAARPATAPSIIRATLEVAAQCGAAVAAQRVTDTIKQADDQGFIVQTIDRNSLRAVQTPQTFRVDVIRRAIQYARDQGLHLTDDTAACELIGQKVALVESPDPNPKATSPTDLPYLEHLLRQNLANLNSTIDNHKSSPSPPQAD